MVDGLARIRQKYTWGSLGPQRSFCSFTPACQAALGRALIPHSGCLSPDVSSMVAKIMGMSCTRRQCWATKLSILFFCVNWMAIREHVCQQHANTRLASCQERGSPGYEILRDFVRKSANRHAAFRATKYAWHNCCCSCVGRRWFAFIRVIETNHGTLRQEDRNYLHSLHNWRRSSYCLYSKHRFAQARFGWINRQFDRLAMHALSFCFELKSFVTTSFLILHFYFIWKHQVIVVTRICRLHCSLHFSE